MLTQYPGRPTRAYILDPARGEHWMPYTEFEVLYEADPASITMQY